MTSNSYQSLFCSFRSKLFNNPDSQVYLCQRSLKYQGPNSLCQFFGFSLITGSVKNLNWIPTMLCTWKIMYQKIPFLPYQTPPQTRDRSCRLCVGSVSPLQSAGASQLGQYENPAHNRHSTSTTQTAQNQYKWYIFCLFSMISTINFIRYMHIR